MIRVGPAPGGWRWPLRVALATGATWIAGAAPATSAQPTARPVLVELFTSQGCFTCPPAERLLTRLRVEGDGRIIALAFHVDYWDQLGWRDPFSSSKWSRRQEAYLRALRTANVYTPQAVVDGRAELVGSDERRLRAAVAAAAGSPAAELRLALAPASGDVAVKVEVELPEALRGRKWDLMLAVYESGLVTAVSGGENRAKELREDHVVRTLLRAARLGADDPSRSEHAASLRLHEDWKRPELGVAAFLQDPKTLEIGGAVAQRLPG